MSKKKENTFSKKERICNVDQISDLFENGSSFISYPVRVVWHVVKSDNNVPVKVLVCVSKKKLKHAVDRNAAKRLVKEAYRLNKSILNDIPLSDNTIFIAFIWLSIDKVDFVKVNKKMAEALRKIKTNICTDEVD